MRCSLTVTAVRAAPSDASEQVTQALLGEPLSVRERRRGWARITTVYGYEGWVSEAALEDGNGRLPAPLQQSPLEIARSYLRAPYLWGGLTHAGIDCSGLVHIAYRLTGVLVPRDAWQQEQAGSIVDRSDLAAGMLVTYGTSSRADHIAFWLGDGSILHSTARDALGVVEESEPEALAATRRRIIRL
jgi:cell wall-associated NlpC family hydrolase